MNNLQQTSIFTVPILADGSPGEITPYVATEHTFIGSGIALDADGRVDITDGIQNGVLRVAPDALTDHTSAAPAKRPMIPLVPSRRKRHLSCRFRDGDEPPLISSRHIWDG